MEYRRQYTGRSHIVAHLHALSLYVCRKFGKALAISTLLNLDGYGAGFHYTVFLKAEPLHFLRLDEAIASGAVFVIITG